MKSKYILLIALSIFLIGIISAEETSNDTGLIKDIINFVKDLFGGSQSNEMEGENQTQLIEVTNTQIISEPIPLNKQEVSFYDKKISNSNGILIISQKEFQPIWNGNKTTYVIDFEIRSINNSKKDLKEIKDFMKQFEKYNPTYTYSDNSTQILTTKGTRETENETDRIITEEQVYENSFTNYKIFETSKDLDLSKNISIKLTFERPRFTKEKFNISFSDKDGNYLLDPDLGECGTISSAGTYTLNTSLTSSTTCITISAQNVTLDCQGNTITYSTAGTASTYGVYTNQFNTTIKNCKIIDGNWTLTAPATRYGIYILTQGNNTIYNNTVNVSNSAGIYLSSSQWNNLTGNRGFTNSSTVNLGGIRLDSGNNTLTSNLGTSTSSTHGIIIFSNAHNNTLISNNGSSNSGRGIYVILANNNILINNNGTSVSGYGIYIASSNYDNLTGNNGTSNITWAGIILDASSYNTLTNNIGTSITGAGIQLYSNSKHNTLTNNNGSSVTLYGFYLLTVDNNTLISNAGNGVSGIYLKTASNTTLISNNGTGSSGSGFYLESSQWNNFTNNIGIATGSTANNGGFAILSGNNTFTNNNGTATSSESGIVLVGGSQNILTGNNGTSTSGSASGIYLVSGANNNILTNNIGVSNSATGGYGILIYTNANNNILNGNNGTANAGQGITLYTVTNNTLTNNTGRASLSGSGIWIYTNANNNTLIGNNGTSVTGFGIYVASSGNNTFIDNNGTGNSNTGFYVTGSQWNNLTGNNGSTWGLSANMAGIRLDSGNNTLLNNKGVSNYTSTYGIYLFAGTSNITMEGNNGSSNSGNAILLGGNNNTLINNYAVSISGQGIAMAGATYNILVNNTGVSNSGYGIYMSTSRGNNLTKNIGTSNSGYGIFVRFAESSNNILTDNIAISNVSYALAISLNSNNTFINQTAITTGTSGANRFGVLIDGSNNTLFQDCNNISGGYFDVYYTTSLGSVNNTFLNCSYNLSKEVIQGAGNELMRKWYYQAYVNYSNGTAVNGANVSAFNSSGILRFTDLTNSSGYTPIEQLREYINIGGTRTYASNYTINATSPDSTYGNTSNSINITGRGNVLNDFLTLNQTIPIVIFNLQSPADLNLSNFRGSENVNITYNITGSNLNSSTFLLYYKSNSSVSNIQYYVNGTSYSGFFSKGYTDNISSTYRFNLNDDDVLPASYNLNQSLMDSTPHNSNNLLNQNYIIKVEILNVSNSTAYGDYEIMLIKNLAIGGASNAYYCNSSYTTGNPTTSNNCALVFSLTARTTYDHSEGFSGQNIIPFAVNTTTGKFGNVIITSKSYFLSLGSAGAGTWSFSSVAITSRLGAMQTSINLGTSYTNQTYTVDAHLHQYDINSTLFYYACANDTNNNSVCSSLREDLFEFAGLPPSSPQVISPVNLTYPTNIWINYTKSVSPNEYQISYYNISLYNSDMTFNKTLVANNSGSDNLSYYWNTSSEVDGLYIIGVRAYDNLSQNSEGFSEHFTLLYDRIHPYFVNIPSNQSINYGTDWGGAYFNATDDAFGFVNYSIDNKNFTINQVGFLNWTGQLAVGDYYVNVSINDTNSNENWTIYNLKITKGIPLLNLISSVGWNLLSAGYSTITGTNCPSQLTCSLWEIGISVTNPYTTLFSAGSYLFTYNATGNANYTDGSISNTLNSQVNATSGINGTIVATGTTCRLHRPLFDNVNIGVIRRPNYC